jgi:lipid II:glycine glycyltransferase (peptidoglycan interpeptide bridge formation enzyme)
VTDEASPVRPTVAQLRRDDAAWDAFVAGSSTPFHLQQTPWAVSKRPNGWTSIRVVADGGSGPIGAQVLIRKLGPGPFGVGYAARGPVATTWDEPSLAAFTAALRKAARTHYLTHVTVDPGMEDVSVALLLRHTGWKDADAVQHDRSRVVDLSGGEAAAWGALRSKWRQYVGKATRGGAVVIEGDRGDLPAFHAILADTAQRTGFFHRTLASYEAVWDAYRPTGQASLLLARTGAGDPVAALFLVRCGPRMTEPYGGMTDAGADSRANYLLKWEALRRSIAAGCTLYDMWGLAHPGIEQFKAGFGGYEVHYVGAFDLVTLPLLRDVMVTGRRLWVRGARRFLMRTPKEPTAAPAAAPATADQPAPTAPAGDDLGPGGPA